MTSFFCLSPAFQSTMQAIRSLSFGFPFGKRRQRRLRGCGRAFLCLSHLLLSLSCVPAFSASDSAPIFFFVLPKKKTAAGGQKKKGALYGLDKGPIQPDFQQTAGAYRASSKGLCAPPDAQPLTLAVCAAWRCHCRFHSVRLNGEKAENLLKRPALLRRTTRDSAMPPGLPGSAAERPRGHKRPLDMKDLFLLYRVAAFFFS